MPLDGDLRRRLVAGEVCRVEVVILEFVFRARGAERDEEACEAQHPLF
jgi:hypothetical protein